MNKINSGKSTTMTGIMDENGVVTVKVQVDPDNFDHSPRKGFKETNGVAIGWDEIRKEWTLIAIALKKSG